MIPKSLAPKAEETEKSGHLVEKTHSEQQSEEAQVIQENVDEEFDDMPALEETDLTTESGPSNEQTIPVDIVPEVAKEAEIIEINAPSSEPSSIFGKQKSEKKSSDIFADLVSESEDEDEKDEDVSTVHEPFLIEQSSSSKCLIEEPPAAPKSGNKLLIEEVGGSDTKKVSTPSKPKKEKLNTPSQPKKSPFLITEVHSSDLNDMFCKQDDLLNDDVEQIYVGDAHEEVESNVRVVRPANDDFLSRLGQTNPQSSGNQSKC